MKRLMVITLLALAAYVVPAAEETSYYKAGEINVSIFGGVTTPDFNSERTSIGASAGLFATENIGAEIEASGRSAGGRLIDQAAAQLVYRIPVKKSAPYLFAGAYHDFDRREFGISVGVGIEHRFTHNFGVFTDARLEKLWSAGDPAARARAGVRFAF